MPTFEDHIKQAERNLIFLENVNENIPDSIDWQITVAFYTAVHLANAHLSKFNIQSRNHTETKNYLNFANELSITAIPEQEYLSYKKLENLSRRSRYIVEVKDDNLDSPKAALSYEKHLSKAIKHLDKIYSFFQKKYKLEMPKISLTCSGIKQDELKHISVASN